jgi:sorting nexin-8
VDGQTEPQHNTAGFTTNGYTNPQDQVLWLSSASAGDCRDSRWTVSEGHDIEAGQRQVKRRRLSNEPEQVLSSLTSVNGTSCHSAWQERLQEAAIHSVDSQSPEAESDWNHGVYHALSDPFSRSQPTQPIENPPSALQDLPKPFASLQNDQPTQNSANDLPQLDGAMDNPPLKRTKATSTPKTSLKTEQGKLNFSSVTSPRRSPRSTNVQPSNVGNETKKSRRSTKKVEMKRGKLVSSLHVTLPYSAPGSAARIDEILAGSSQQNDNLSKSQAARSAKEPVTAKATHPFFLGKAPTNAQILKLEMDSEQTASTAPTSDDEAVFRSSPKPPKVSKDIVFGSNKTPRLIAAALPPIWPPTDLQHIHPVEEQRSIQRHHSSISRGASKLKQSAPRVRSDEDVLIAYSRSIQFRNAQTSINVPLRRIMSGNDLSELLPIPAMTPGQRRSYLNARIASTPSSFDRGMAAGPHLWYQEYAPTCWQDLLSPEQGEILYNWLSNLQVHQVKSGKIPTSKPVIVKKQRKKRKSDEMSDFIALSDDEDSSTPSSKTAILLVGPPGSGKTASVFAVAQQLDFEVFEIHPGMRRTAKDIQDKVGDMTQNHLVQQSKSISRESSILIDDDDARALRDDSVPAKQKSMVNFMNPKGGKQPNAGGAKANAKASIKSQKQSLILFEEVDILFDDDKGFWGCVQWLVKTSKRPVILTCNDLASVPINDLDLFTVLQYSRPRSDIATQHLQHIAAAEGHLLSQESLTMLYSAKGQDLRSSIAELNTWCQMTIGSKQGGLDWMLSQEDKRKANVDGSVTRIVSQDTYFTGLDLLPEKLDDLDDLIRYAHDSLEIPPVNWIRDEFQLSGNPASVLQSLEDAYTLCDARSAIDLLDETAAPIIAGSVRRICTSSSQKRPDPRAEIVNLYLKQHEPNVLDASDFNIAFESLLEESRIGLPTAPGRKAPSLDYASALSVITDVAPYIRSIVSHDIRLGQLRHELHGFPQTGDGANKRQRRTRAARAAMEGGTKDTTRRDKWFTEELDWDAVLRTGGNWPTARADDVVKEEPSGPASEGTSTPASTPL